MTDQQNMPERVKLDPDHVGYDRQVIGWASDRIADDDGCEDWPEYIKADLAQQVFNRNSGKIGWQDIRLVAGEGKLKPEHILQAVNVIIAQRERRIRSHLAWTEVE